jgi:hypothetical protein
MTTTNDLLGLLNQIRDTQLEQASEIGKMSGQLESLAGPLGRVKALEDTNVRQYWLHAAVLPVLLTIHGFARKVGLTL